MGTWIVIVLVYGSLPACLIALAWATRRMRQAATGACTGCGYSLEGLNPVACCPECGTRRSEMSMPWGNEVSVIRTGALSLLGPSIAAVVAASISLAVQGVAEVPGTVAIAVFPYVVPMSLITASPLRRTPRCTAAFITALSGLCSAMFGLVLVISSRASSALWDEPVDNFNIMVLSSAYFWVFAGAGACWVMASWNRRRKRQRQPVK